MQISRALGGTAVLAILALATSASAATISYSHVEARRTTN